MYTEPLGAANSDPIRLYVMQGVNPAMPDTTMSDNKDKPSAMKLLHTCKYGCCASTAECEAYQAEVCCCRIYLVAYDAEWSISCKLHLWSARIVTADLHCIIDGQPSSDYTSWGVYVHRDL